IRLRAVRRADRPGADRVLLGQGGRARLGVLAVALVGPLGTVVYGRAMKRSSKTDETSAVGGGAAPKRRAAEPRTRVASALESAIGYRFKDSGLLDRALTHISAVTGGHRGGSYQRMEFLGDHVLGLVISDMLFRAFPKADEGELSRRLADLVRRETCA